MNVDSATLWVVVQERQREIAKLEKYRQYRESGQLHGAQLKSEQSKAAGLRAVAQFVSDSVRGVVGKPAVAGQASKNPC
jgi:hypothetical protein